MIRTIALSAAALALSGLPVSAHAQATAPATVSETQQEHAVQDFAVMSSAMHSDKVGDDVKAALMGCIYSNKLETISTAIDKLIAANPGKVDRSKPDDVLSAMVAICGYKPSATAGAPAPKTTPAPKGAAPVGR